MNLRDLLGKLTTFNINAGARGKSLMELPVVVNIDGEDHEIVAVVAAEGDNTRLVLWIED